MSTEAKPDTEAGPPNQETRLEIAELTKELRNLQGHYAMRSLQSRKRMMLAQFLRGLSFGLGSVIGATILVSVSVYLLSQIDFIPIIGDWAAQIANEISPENVRVDDASGAGSAGTAQD